MSRRATPSLEEPIDDDAVLTLLGDEYVREILRALTDGPATANELTDRCRGSKVTVYRRLNSLEEDGLVRATTDVGSDGHHSTVYCNAIDEVAVSIAEDGLEVAVSRTNLRC